MLAVLLGQVRQVLASRVTADVQRKARGEFLPKALRSGPWLTMDFRTEELGLEQFQRVCLELQERVDRGRRQHEFDIKRWEEISDRTFVEFLPEILELHDSFRAFDKDDSGFLDQEELTFVIKQKGLVLSAPVPKSELDFRGFLGLVAEFRLQLRALHESEHRRVFNKFDRDGSEELSCSEAAALLAHLGLVPRSTFQQDEITKIIDETDADGSGELDFEEFEVLFYRVSERLQAWRFAEDRFAETCGFISCQVREFRWAFELVDKDKNMSGSLDVIQIGQALRLLRRDPEQEWTSVAIHSILGNDGNGEMTFQQFLELIASIAEVSAPLLDTPEGLNDEELQLLLEPCIKGPSRPELNIDPEEVQRMGRGDRIDLLCRLANIASAERFAEKQRGPKTVEQLACVIREACRPT